MIGSKPVGKGQDPGFDVHENSLIRGGFLGIGIFDLPLLDLGKVAEDALGWETRHVDDEIGIVEEFAAKRLRRELVGGIAVGKKGLRGALHDVAEWIEARARGFDDVGSPLTRDGFCHGAATGIAEADEEDAEFV